jgi:cell filamentation protein
VNPYVDPATGTPRNKLGLADREALAKVEYQATHIRIAQLRDKPIQGNFDLAHLRAIHRHIFQDIYEWAGKERTINFSKNDPLEPWWTSVFARTEHIPMIAESVSSDLAAWDNLKGLGKEEFAKRLASIYVKVNHMHPFPEGNGRSTQTFMAQLALEAGYHIRYDRIDPALWNAAAARSMPQVNKHEPGQKREADPRLIGRVFLHIVEPTRAKEIEIKIQHAATVRTRDNTAGYER